MNADLQSHKSVHAVELEGLSKAFGSVRALGEVTLSVPSGALVAVLGPSGSGKSTLLGVIAGFIPQDRGTIHLFGHLVRRDLPSESRGLGMVFQQPTLFPHYSVWNNIAFPLRARGIDGAALHAKVASAVRLVGIDGLEQRLPHTLSGGQQQRVALARALVFEPQLVLLDEPLSALDRPTRELLQEEIRQLQRRTLATFVHVTHDREEALAMANLIVIMRDGHVVQVGRPEELYWRPQSEFVARFFGACNVARGTVRQVDGYIETVADAGVLLSRAGGTPAAAAGGDVPVVLWPELLRVTAADDPRQLPSSVPARILDRRFLGHTSLLTLDTPIGVVKARVNLARDAASACLQDAVRLSWNPKEARALFHQPALTA